MALTAQQIAALKTVAGNPSNYSDGLGSMTDQFTTQMWIKEALIEAAPKQWFSQNTSTVNAQQHNGKKLVRYLYLPLLDDRNDNDQGIDATGAVIANGNLYGSSRDTNRIMQMQPNLTEYGGRVNRVYFQRQKIEGVFEEFGFFYEYSEDEIMFDTDMDLKKHLYREALRGATKLQEDRLQIDLLNAAATILFGGSAQARDELSGDANGVISTVTYDALVELALKLDDLNVPEDTKVIKGSRLVDTLTLNSARLMYVGTEVIKDLMRLKDYHGERAFIEYKRYADASGRAVGEVGAVESFRIVKIGKDMTYAPASGALVGINGANSGYRASMNDAGELRYDVHFMMVVGGESFQTIAFKRGYGKGNNFEIFTQAPKPKIRHRDDPYGKIGFAVISWWYGLLILREERICRIEVVAKK